MRCRRLPTCSSAPSATCVMETPSFALRSAWAKLRTWAFRFSLMARPAASSAALEMRIPDERCDRLRAIADCVLDRLRCALIEARLVLMTSDMVVGLSFRSCAGAAGQWLGATGLCFYCSLLG